MLTINNTYVVKTAPALNRESPNNTATRLIKYKKNGGITNKNILIIPTTSKILCG